MNFWCNCYQGLKEAVADPTQCATICLLIRHFKHNEWLILQPTCVANTDTFLHHFPQYNTHFSVWGGSVCRKWDFDGHQTVYMSRTESNRLETYTFRQYTEKLICDNYLFLTEEWVRMHLGKDHTVLIVMDMDDGCFGGRDVYCSICTGGCLNQNGTLLWERKKQNRPNICTWWWSSMWKEHTIVLWTTYSS